MIRSEQEMSAVGSKAVILKVGNDFRSSPQQRTCDDCFGMSVSCQQRKSSRYQLYLATS